MKPRSISWYRFWVTDGKVTKVEYNPTATGHLKRGYFSLKPSQFVIAKDELDAFLLATQWVERGMPQASNGAVPEWADEGAK